MHRNINSYVYNLLEKKNAELYIKTDAIILSVIHN